MKKEIYYDEQFALEAGVQALRRYNRVMYISLQDSDINEELAKKFFLAEPNSAEEKDIAKMMTVAAAQAMYNHPDIFKFRREQCAKRCSREFLQALQGAKCDYLYEMGEYGVGLKAMAKYEKELKIIPLVGTASNIKKAKNMLVRRSERIVTYNGVKKLTDFVVDETKNSSIIAKAIYYTGSIVTNLIPSEQKEKIKEKAHEYFDRAKNVVEKAVKRFEKTDVGEKVVKVIREKVAPVVERGVKILKDTYNEAKSMVKSGWTKFKSLFA